LASHPIKEGFAMAQTSWKLLKDVDILILRDLEGKLGGDVVATKVYF